MKFYKYLRMKNYGKLENNYSNRRAQWYEIFFYKRKILQNGQKFPGKNSKFNGDLNWFLHDPYEGKIVFLLFHIIFF